MDGKELRRVIEQYFHLGYENQVILAFLNSGHGITMSLATLKQRFRDYGLSRSYIEVDDQQLREVVQREMSREFIKSILPEITLHCSIKILAGTSSLFFDHATSNQRIFLLYPSKARCIGKPNSFNLS